MAGIPIVSEEVLKGFKQIAKALLNDLRNRKRKSFRDKLNIEYLKTFLDNPTPMNYILLTCGRGEEMTKKKEDV